MGVVAPGVFWAEKPGSVFLVINGFVVFVVVIGGGGHWVPHQTFGKRYFYGFVKMDMDIDMDIQRKIGPKNECSV